MSNPEQDKAVALDTETAMVVAAPKPDFGPIAFEDNEDDHRRVQPVFV